jgi:sugar lactone lactonase YvrE
MRCHTNILVLPCVLLSACQALFAPLDPVVPGRASERSQAALTAIEPLRGPLYGRVVAGDGRPVAGAAVRAFLNNTTPLVGGSGGALNNTTPYRSAAALALAAGLDTTSDSQGRFRLVPDQEGDYNVEAVQSEASKAWRARVAVRRGSEQNAGTLTVAPVGQIAGKVRASDPAVTNFSNTFVYIPGSSYLAVTRADGSYTIAGVPAGEFDLGAYNQDLGDGRLPDDANPGAIKVRPNETTTAPAITIRTVPPQLTAIRRARTEDVTDNGAPGQEIDLAGKFFGQNRGAKFEVRFSGATATTANRLSEELIRVKVPPGAQNGETIVVVGGMLSGPLNFRAMRAFRLRQATLALAADQEFDLAGLADATDSAAVPIVGDGAGKHPPNVDWSVDSDRGSILRGSVLRALTAGTVTVTARAGDLPPATLAVEISGAGAGTPTPAPTPTAAPTPTRSPAPTPLPAIVTPAGRVSTLAGAGGGRDGPANDATFFSPIGLARDSAGSLFVTEFQGNRVRKIAADGTVTTVAGNGLPGYFDGVGVAAQFDMPTGIAVDASGTLYVAEHGLHRIRKIAPDGQVSVMAGGGEASYRDGDARSARFSYPNGIAVDAAGNLYVADSNSHAIRKITPGGSVTTLAGGNGRGYQDGSGGTARFASPIQLAQDRAGNLIVAEYGANRIRKVAPDGTVSTIAGSGQYDIKDGPALAASFISPVGVAIDGLDRLWVLGLQQVRRLASGNVTTVAGDASAGFSDTPGSTAQFLTWGDAGGPLAADEAGNLYVADAGNHRIRKVASDGSVTTLSGDARADGSGIQARFGLAHDLAVDDTGTIFVADSHNRTVRRVTPTGEVTTLAGSKRGHRDGPGATALLSGPLALAALPSGDLLFSDGYWIRRISPGGAVSTIGGTGNSPLKDGPLSDAQFNYPNGLVAAPDGTVYVADTSNQAIRKIDGKGQVTTLAGSGEIGFADASGRAARFGNPMGIVRDQEGTLFVADHDNHRIRRVDLDGTVSTLAGGAAGFADGTGSAAAFNHPAHLTFGHDGILYVADADNHAIRGVDPKTGAVSTLAGQPMVAGFADGLARAARFYRPWAIAVDPTGRLVVFDQFNMRLRRIE